MTTPNQLDSATDGAAFDDATIDAPHLNPASGEEIAAEAVDDASEYVPYADEQSGLRFPAAQGGHSKTRQVVRGLLKPLLTAATAQYTLVTLLAGLAAYAVASSASKFINANFEPIIAALKRL